MPAIAAMARIAAGNAYLLLSDAVEHRRSLASVRRMGSARVARRCAPSPSQRRSHALRRP